MLVNQTLGHLGPTLKRPESRKKLIKPWKGKRFCLFSAIARETRSPCGCTDAIHSIISFLFPTFVIHLTSEFVLYAIDTMAGLTFS